MRHEVATPMIPAGTPQGAPVEIMTTFDPGTVTEIQVTTPGVATTAIQIAIAHQVVFPYRQGTWIQSTTTSQNFTFTVEGLPESGQWSVYGYNTGGAIATWQLYFAVHEIPDRKYTPSLEVQPALTALDVMLAARAQGLNGVG